MTATVDIEELQDAVELLSAAFGMGTRVIISRDNGRLYYLEGGEFIGDDAPGDSDDQAEYLEVPHKNDLDLGNRMVTRFIGELLPEAIDEVDSIFASKGANARFKGLLAKRGKLEQWYRFEEGEIQRVLREWLQENGLAASAG